MSVDVQYISAYRQIAALILKNLFGISLGEPTPAATLGRLVALWNQIEEALKEKLLKAGIDRGHTFYWEEAMKAGVVESSDISKLTELRMMRNRQVHSTTFDSKEIAYAINLAEGLFKKLKP